jgi:hypothetical protein
MAPTARHSDHSAVQSLLPIQFDESPNRLRVTWDNRLRKDKKSIAFIFAFWIVWTLLTMR